MDEIRELVEKRLEYIRQEIKFASVLVNDPCNGRFWQGKVTAFDGELGEVQFLNKLLENLETLESEEK